MIKGKNKLDSSLPLDEQPQILLALGKSYFTFGIAGRRFARPFAHLAS